MVLVPLIGAIGFGCATNFEKDFAKSSIITLENIKIVEIDEHCVYAEIEKEKSPLGKEICDYYNVLYEENLYKIKKITPPNIELWANGDYRKKDFLKIGIKDLDIFK